MSQICLSLLNNWFCHAYVYVVLHVQSTLVYLNQGLPIPGIMTFEKKITQINTYTSFFSDFEQIFHHLCGNLVIVLYFAPNSYANRSICSKFLFKRYY